MKDVIGYEDNYRVTAIGTIVSKRTNRPVYHYQSKNGYMYVTLYKENVGKRKSVHRLVFETYKGKAPKDINHIDGNKTNNCIENLESCTRSQNMKHAYYKLGAMPGRKKLTHGLSSWIKDHLNVLSNKNISSMIGISRQSVNDIRQGRTWHRNSEFGGRKHR